MIPSRPPPAERTVEDRPFFLVHKHPDNPHERVDISFSIHASQLVEHEALGRKTAAAFSNALSIAEYIYNQPEITEESTLSRTVHNSMLMRHSIALDNLSRSIPLIDSDQKGRFTSRTFHGYYPFLRRVTKAAESQQGMC